MLIEGDLVPLPRFLDIEASSLSVKSYPIEIAWSDSKGAIESYLINPEKIYAWNDWDFQAQTVHGITRKTCCEKGMNPVFVCKRLSHSIKPGEVVYADGGLLDQNWIDELYAVSSAMPYSSFRVIHSDCVMLPLLAKVEANHNRQQLILEELKSAARCKVSSRHRATPDVQYLIELYRSCLEYKHQS